MTDITEFQIPDFLVKSSVEVSYENPLMPEIDIHINLSMTQETFVLVYLLAHYFNEEQIAETGTMTLDEFFSSLFLFCYGLDKQIIKKSALNVA